MNDYINRIDNFIAPAAERGGFRLARVGGSVRDEILGRRIKDADYVAFGVSLDKLGMLLRDLCAGPSANVTPLKLRDGRQAGWRIFKKGYGLIEIALPRKEVSTGPGHRDFKIVLDPSLDPAEDAIRRDFTFNALYKWVVGGPRAAVAHGTGHSYGILENIEDPTGRGLYDLAHKIVNTTHEDSFRDDPLRTLRALRFVSVLGYDLGSRTEAQMYAHADAVTGLVTKRKLIPSAHVEKLDGGHTVIRKRGAVEEVEVTNTSGTVLDEMNKLLMGDDVAKSLRLMRDTGVMAVLFPELAPMLGFDQGSKYHDLTTDEHTFTALHSATKFKDVPLRVRWALLFHDAGKPATAWVGDDGRKHYYAKPEKGVHCDHEEASELLWLAAATRMNVPRNLREDVATLIREHMVSLQPRNATVKVRRARVKFGDDLLRDLYLHRACDVMGKGKVSASQMKHVADLMELRSEAEDAGIPSSRKDLSIRGIDLVGMRVEGRQIGEILDKILDEVVCQPTERRMSREWQMARARELAK